MTNEERENISRSLEGKSIADKRMAVMVRFGADIAKKNFPEFFIGEKPTKEISQQPLSSYGANHRKNQKRRQNRCVLVRAMGKIRWYNGKNPRTCGIIITNNYKLPSAETNPGQLIEVELRRGEWKEELEPQSGDWVVFSLRKEGKHYIAAEVIRLQGSVDHLCVAFQYVGSFAQIQGKITEKRFGTVCINDSIKKP